MGAWGADPFGNDTACDWKYDLDDTDDLSVIEKTIKKIHRCRWRHVDSSDAEEAIAAADVIARLRGHFYVRNSYTESVDNWVAAHKIEPPEKLVDAAVKAIDRILTPPSELLDLWADSDDAESWKQHLEDLKGRLRCG